jgi:hypothetical protein
LNFNQVSEANIGILQAYLEKNKSKWSADDLLEFKSQAVAKQPKYGHRIEYVTGMLFFVMIFISALLVIAIISLLIDQVYFMWIVGIGAAISLIAMLYGISKQDKLDKQLSNEYDKNFNEWKKFFEVKIDVANNVLIGDDGKKYSSFDEYLNTYE